MEFEDSRNALFAEPNAYVQHYKKQERTKPTKVVFQEPYDCLPNYYMNNNFTKREAEREEKKENQKIEEKHMMGLPFNFDFKSLMPLLTSLLGGSNLGGILSSLAGSGESLDLSKIMSGVLQNPSSLSSILNLFKGNKTNRKEDYKKLKQTDYEIKNYTRV